MFASKNDTLKVGISGGTFDPIHIGHMEVAKKVREAFGLDKVFFIPVGNPPHKNLSSVTPSLVRLSMVRDAIADNEYFEVVDIEVNRPGYTYTIDTLKELHEKYKNTKFYYMIGADVVFDILKWKDYQDVFKLCEFVAVLRPQFDKTEYINKINMLRENHQAVIHIFNSDVIDVSSTMIRNRIKQGLSVKQFVTQNVEEYIYKNGLYRGEQ